MRTKEWGREGEKEKEGREQGGLFLNFFFCSGVQPINNAIVSGGRRGTQPHIHVSIPPIPLPSRLPHNPEQRSLCYTVDSWLFTLNIAVYTCVRAHSLQPCPPFCDAMDCSPPGSSVHGILQAGIYWSGLPCPPPGDLPDPGITPSVLTSPALAGGFFTTTAT